MPISKHYRNTTYYKDQNKLPREKLKCSFCIWIINLNSNSYSGTGFLGPQLPTIFFILLCCLLEYKRSYFCQVGRWSINKVVALFDLWKKTAPLHIISVVHKSHHFLLFFLFKPHAKLFFVCLRTTFSCSPLASLL